MSVSVPALLVAAGGVGFGHAVLPDHWAPIAVLGRARGYPARRVARLSALAGVAHVLVSVVLGAVVVAVGLQFRATVSSIEGVLVGGILIATGIGFAALELFGHGHHHGPGGHTHGPVGHTHDPGERHHGPVGHTHGPGEHHHDAGGHTHGADHAHHDHSHEPGHEHPQPALDQHGHPDHSPGAGPDAAPPRTGLFAILIPFGAAASPDLTILPVFLAATAAGTSAAVGSLLVFSAVTVGTIVSLTLVAFSSGRLIDAGWLEQWGNTITAGVLIVIGVLVLSGII